MLECVTAVVREIYCNLITKRHKRYESDKLLPLLLGR